MKRRKFITLIGGAAAAWPLAARTQQAERVRRIGMLIPFRENDPETQARLAAFKQQLQKLGWAEGRNLRIDYRFAGDNIERIRIGAEELVAVAPDVIVVYANPAVAALRQATRVMPIVFAQVSDPVGSGFVTSLARPGGNITGFQNFEPEIGGKWLEVLKQIAPAVRRVAVVHGPDIAVNVAFLHAAEAASTPLGITVTAAGVRSGDDIESTLAAFAREPNGGLIVAPSPINLTNRELIMHRLPSWVCQRSIRTVTLPKVADWLPMDLTKSSKAAERPLMSIGSSKERSQPTCQCKHRPNMSSSLISRPPGRSG